MDEPTAALGVAETRVEEIILRSAAARRAAGQPQPRSGVPPVGSHLRVAPRQAGRRAADSGDDKHEIVSMITGLSRGEADA